MISNLDIERRKSIRNKPNPLTRKTNPLTRLTEYEAALIKSRKLSRFMERILRSYASGCDSVKLPFFYPKFFPQLCVMKFNSYGLESRAVYDYLNRSITFIPINSHNFP